jgi:hypothetical protein
MVYYKQLKPKFFLLFDEIKLWEVRLMLRQLEKLTSSISSIEN